MPIDRLHRVDNSGDTPFGVPAHHNATNSNSVSGTKSPGLETVAPGMARNEKDALHVMATQSSAAAILEDQQQHWGKLRSVIPQKNYRVWKVWLPIDSFVLLFN